MFGGQTAFCQHGTDLVLCHCRKFAPDLFDTGRSVLRIGLLLKITDMLIIAKMHFAGIRFDQLQNAFQKRGLTDTVCTGQGNAFAAFHADI